MTADLASLSAHRDADEGRDPASPSERLLERLLRALIATTEDESRRWETDDAHDDSYCLVGPGWLVATRSVDGDGTAPYAIVMAGPAGELVLEVVSTSAFGRPLAPLFARLHAAAAATASMSEAYPVVTGIVADLLDGVSERHRNGAADPAT
jgi:hypothetical protein